MIIASHRRVFGYFTYVHVFEFPKVERKCFVILSYIGVIGYSDFEIFGMGDYFKSGIEFRLFFKMPIYSLLNVHCNNNFDSTILKNPHYIQISCCL